MRVRISSAMLIIIALLAQLARAWYNDEMSSKEYHREYNKDRYHRLRAKYIELLGGSCNVCNTTENLQFDHVDSSSKTIELSRLLNHSQSVIIKELNKCQLLCKQCHLDKSIRSRDFKGGHNKITDPDHGTWAMYTNFKCRCDQCREWRRNYRLKLVDARGNSTHL